MSRLSLTNPINLDSVQVPARSVAPPKLGKVQAVPLAKSPLLQDERAEVSPFRRSQPVISTSPRASTAVTMTFGSKVEVSSASTFTA